MTLARRAARAALAASFISGGIDQIRNPQPKAGPASPIAKPIADRVPQLPNDPESLVKLDGAIKVVGGVAMVVGPFARPAALLLAGSMVPTTLAAHRFWETTDPEQKVSDRVEFFKNVSLVGGLLIAALDTGGRPSVPWVAGKALHGAAETVGETAGTVGHAVGSVGETLAGAAGAVAAGAGAVGGAVAHGAGKAAHVVPGVGDDRSSKRSRKKAAKSAARAQKRAGALAAALAATTQDYAGAAKDWAGSAKGTATEWAGTASDRAGSARKSTRKQLKAYRKAAKSSGYADAARGYASNAKDAAKDAAGAAKVAAAEAAKATKDGAVAAKEKVGAAVSR